MIELQYTDPLSRWISMAPLGYINLAMVVLDSSKMYLKWDWYIETFPYTIIHVWQALNKQVVED